MKSTYGMSSVGGCSRALAAEKLGYEPIARTKDDEDRLAYYSSLEDVAANQIIALGYKLQPSTLCQICLEKYGKERHGIHIEIDMPNFLLVGHLDRRLLLSKDYPTEIKGLGKPSWTKFAKEGFNGFLGYAAQEACYLHAEQLPGIYWVMNRDTGKPLKYIVNDYGNELNLDGFEKVELPITFEQIVDKLNNIEVHLSISELPPGDEPSSCIWCQYRYVCSNTDKSGKDVQTLDAPILIEAGKQYTEGHAMVKQGTEMKSKATFTLMSHAKANSVDKYRAGGVSVTYRGVKQDPYFDTKTFKAQNQEMYDKYVKLKQPYEDCSVRVLKDKEEK